MKVDEVYYDGNHTFWMTKFQKRKLELKEWCLEHNAAMHFRDSIGDYVRFDLAPTMFYQNENYEEIYRNLIMIFKLRFLAKELP